jgi:hypothetical protein
MVEVEEHEAKDMLQAGLEQAARTKGTTIGAYGYYVPDTTT